MYKLIIDRGSLNLKLTVFKDDTVIGLKISRLYSGDDSSFIIEVKDFIDSIDIRIDEVVYILPRQIESMFSIKETPRGSTERETQNKINKETPKEKKTIRDISDKIYSVEKTMHKQIYQYYLIDYNSDEISGVRTMLKKLGIKTVHIYDYRLILTALVPRIGKYLILDIGDKFSSYYKITDGAIEEYQQYAFGSDLIGVDLDGSEDGDIHEMRSTYDFSMLNSEDVQTSFKVRFKSVIRDFPENDGIIVLGGVQVAKPECLIDSVNSITIDCKNLKGTANQSELKYRQYIMQSLAANEYTGRDLNIINDSINKLKDNKLMSIFATINSILIIILALSLVAAFTIDTMVEENLTPPVFGDTQVVSKEIDAIKLEIDNIMYSSIDGSKEIYTLGKILSLVGENKDEKISISNLTENEEGEIVLVVKSSSNDSIRAMVKRMEGIDFSSIYYASTIVESGIYITELRLIQ